MPLPLRRRHRSRPSGQLLLFDLLDRITPSDELATPPGTSLTPLDPDAEPDQDSPLLLSPKLWAALPLAPGRKAGQRPVTGSADQVVRPDSPTFEHTAAGDPNDALPSTDGEQESIVSPLDRGMRLQLADEMPPSRSDMSRVTAKSITFDSSILVGAFAGYSRDIICEC